MSCNNCTSVKLIPTCVDELIIGFIPFDTTDVFVYIKNTTSGHIEQFEATSDADALVALDLSLIDKSFFNENSFYELWVTLQDGQIDDKLDITMQGSYVPDTYTCLNLLFSKISAVDGLATFTSHTLEIDA